MNHIDVTLVQVGYGDDETGPQRIDRVSNWVRSLPPTDLIMLPELWVHGGFAASTWAENAEPLTGTTVRRLADLAAELRTWIHAGSIIEKADATADQGPLGRGLWNTSILFSPTGTLHATYSKMHRFGFGEGEPQLLEAGENVTTTDLNWTGDSATRVGLATCYDLRFPEMFRTLGDHNTEIVLIPAAWPFPRVEHWRLLGQARAIENQTWVLQCNTAGTHSGVEMGGHSRVVSPTGEVIAELGKDEGVLTARLDLDHVRTVRESFPVLDDRKPSLR